VKKLFLSVVIALVVLMVIAAILVGFFLGPIVKAGMETVGPKLTGVSIKVDAVNLLLLSGSAKIKGTRRPRPSASVPPPWG